MIERNIRRILQASEKNSYGKPKNGLQEFFKKNRYLQITSGKLAEFNAIYYVRYVLTSGSGMDATVLIMTVMLYHLFPNMLHVCLCQLLAGRSSIANW